MKKLSEKNPILFSIGVAVLFLLIVTGLEILTSGIVVKEQYAIYVICELIAASYAIAMLFVVNQKYVLTRFSAKSFFGGLLTGGFYICQGLYSLIVMTTLALCWDNLSELHEALNNVGYNFSNYEVMPGVHIFLFIIYMLLVGFAEEITFRGIISELLAKKMATSVGKTRLCILISGVIFGGVHLGNAVSTGISSAAIQALVASCMGMVLVVMYLKNQNIWANVLVHAYIDIAALAVMGGGIVGSADGSSNIITGMSYGSATLVSVVVYVIILPIMLRRKNMERIMANYQIEE